MQNRIEVMADSLALVDQAAWTAERFMRLAAESIDKNFGDGYAKKNPALVAAMVQASVADFRNTVGLINGNQVADALNDIAAAIARGYSLVEIDGALVDHIVVPVGDRPLVAVEHDEDADLPAARLDDGARPHFATRSNLSRVSSLNVFDARNPATPGTLPSCANSGA